MERRVGLTGALVLAIAFLAAGGARPTGAQETTIGGLIFGDYYYVAGHHDADLEDANGFWARRLYLTVNTKLSDGWDARIRFEAGTKGDFTTSTTMNPFLKDLWVRWRKGRQQILIGLSASPTLELIEGQWGYRHVEKAPLDLYRMAPSRDFGVAFKGSFDESQKVRYHVMFGNGASTKTETNKGKKVMGALQFFPNEHVIAEVYADREDRAEDKDRTTVNGHLVLKGEKGRIGLLASHQTRLVPNGEDTKVDVFSVFGALNAGEKVNLLARWDRMAKPIPDGAKISYFRMDPTSEGNFFLVGLDLKLDDRVSLIPNIEVVSYDDDALSSDVFLRTTFFVRF